MSWEAVAAIGQLASAVGGIGALLYLAAQVKQNTRAVRSTSADAAVAAMNDWMGRLLSDRELERVWRAGQRDLARLSEDDRGRYFLSVTTFLMVSENVHNHYYMGTLDPIAWESWVSKLTYNLSQPGVREVWKVAGSGYSRPFREFVESIQAQPVRPLPLETLKRVGTLEPEPPATEGRA